MAVVDWEKTGNIAIVKMVNNENRQNLVFANDLNKAIDEVLDDSDINAMLLSSASPKHWSLGVDVEWLMTQFNDKNFDAIKQFMYRMNDVFKKLLTLPIPAIAAINGHAFGNGAILSCACDFRFMRQDRGYFCFPEVDLGIPFLPGMVEMVKKAVPAYKLNELKLTGKRAGAAELEEAHVIEKACPDIDALAEETMAFAGLFTKKRGIFSEHKKRMYRHIIEAMDKRDPEYIESLALFIQE
ncbi:MAG: enoyl-CoA hydratase/isomerase family protein [Deltaproteobacteria bacterium]|nr:enoyl-CoA hydratase/isomerase family protein [Deltaproteobacteria bacterium]